MSSKDCENFCLLWLAFSIDLALVCGAASPGWDDPARLRAEVQTLQMQLAELQRMAAESERRERRAAEKYQATVESELRAAEKYHASAEAERRLADARKTAYDETEVCQRPGLIS